MTIERIREMYNAEPFRPFVIYLADGREIAVAHRDFMSIAPSGRTMVVHEPDDSFHIVDLLLVTDLHVKVNGRRSRKGS